MNEKELINFLEGIVTMMEGREKVDKLHELSERQTKIFMCMKECQKISQEDVDAYNGFIDELFTEKKKGKD